MVLVWSRWRQESTRSVDPRGPDDPDGRLIDASQRGSAPILSLRRRSQRVVDRPSAAGEHKN